MAMAMYPGAQVKAQKELDDVLGGALPTISDREKLPYLNALVKEVFRWHPVTTLGMRPCVCIAFAHRSPCTPSYCTRCDCG